MNTVLIKPRGAQNDVIKLVIKYVKGIGDALQAWKQTSSIGFHLRKQNHFNSQHPNVLHAFVVESSHHEQLVMLTSCVKISQNLPLQFKIRLKKV